MESNVWLKPMRPDALMRRPAPQAQFDPSKARLVPRTVEADPEEMHKPVFAPRPVRRDPPADDLDRLLDSFLEEEDDEEDVLQDAVPTECMPVPVCVPLYEQPKKHWWQKR